MSDFFTDGAIAGNTIDMLPTGAWIDDARQKLIRNATRSIWISCFAWEDDATGRGYLGLLTERAAAGVDVRILADNYGARAIEKYQPQLRAQGVRTLFFNPGALWYPQHWIMGMHEKLLLVDGQSVVMGGSGWADPYRESGLNSDVWYDLDVRIDGPAASWFHNSFAGVWQTAAHTDTDTDTSGVLEGPPVGSDEDDTNEDDGDEGAATAAADFEAKYGIAGLYQANAAAVGNVAVLPLHGNPLFTPARPILDAYLAAVAGTRDGGKIRLYSPYCVPVPAFIDALIAARQRGVSVDILTNSLGSTDGGGVMVAAMYQSTAPLRAAGVGIHEWPKKSLMHRKGGVFDDHWAYFGSDNLDRRGQEKQSETVAFTDDAATVKAMAAALDADLALAGPAITEAFVAEDLKRIGGVAAAAASVTLNELALKKM